MLKRDEVVIIVNCN